MKVKNIKALRRRRRRHHHHHHHHLSCATIIRWNRFL